MQGRFIREESGALLAKDAVVVGDVRLAEDSSVWFTCVLRGDDEPITIGARTNVQDGTIVHVDFGHPVVIGDDVTIGHRAIIHGCQIGDACLIGMGATLLTGCEIGAQSIIGAAALVPEGMVVPPRSLVLGVPGKVVRTLRADEMERIAFGAKHYVERARDYL